jgi:hypothetical protein
MACGPRISHEDQRGAATLDARADDWRQELDAMTAGACATTPAVTPARHAVDMTVDATDAWTSSGLFVTRGSNVTVSAAGAWTSWRGVNPETGADGDARLTSQQGCARGSLVARVGLGATDGQFHCVGAQGSFAADTDGIVYLGMNDSSPTLLHAGTMAVTLAAIALPAPTVTTAELTLFDFCGVASGWVELESDSFITLTTPAALAAKHRATLGASLARLDQVVERQSRLAGGASPSGGRRARFYPDPSLRGDAWIVAGNPMRIDPRLLSKQEPSRISLLDVEADDAELFDVVRALGVSISRHSGGRYQPDDKAAQAWGGLFARYVEEERTIGRWPRDPCATAATQAASGSTTGWLADADLQTCFLLRVSEQVGWHVFESFFATIPAPDAWDAAIVSGSGVAAAWEWVVTALEAAAPSEVGPVASELHAPPPRSTP